MTAAAVPLLLPALSGLLLFLSFPPVGWGALAWAALAPLLRSVGEAPHAREAARRGAVAGLVLYPLSLPWMVRVFGPCAAGVWCVFALWVAAFCGMVWHARRRWPRAWPLAAAALWTGIEYFRSEVWPLQNAWLSLGFSQTSLLPFLQVCRFVGVYGLSFLLVLTGGLLSTARRASVVAAAALAMAAGLLGAASFRAAAREGGREVSVALVQDEGADLLRLAALSRAAPEADLIVWPEYAVWTQKGRGSSYRDLLARELRGLRAVSVVGAFTHEGRDVENFAWVLAPGGALLGRYDKLHPIPYVEKRLRPNPGPRPIDTPAGRLGVQICYDLDFEDGSRRMAEQGAQILVVPNIDPEKWGRWQHRQHSAMAAVRAVEAGRWIVRAASSGESQIIDPAGRVRASLPFARPGTLQGRAFLREGRTPYAAAGWLSGPLCLAAAALFGLSLLTAFQRRVLSAVAGVALSAALLLPGGFLLRTAWREKRLSLPPPPAGRVDDAGRQSGAAVGAVVRVPRDPRRAEEAVRAALIEARAEGWKVSIAGARHTMGGHTIVPGGLMLDMGDLDGLSLDPATGVLTAGAGARWSAVLPFLDRAGRSVAVMQSDNVFTVGGSLSVNVHGWQPDHAPFASTVRSLKVMTADGVVRRASRRENPELFSLVLGGYGLFGVVLEAELATVPDEAYRAERRLMAAADLGTAFLRATSGRPDAGLAYGRLSVDPRGFLEEAVLTVYRREPSAVLPAPSSPRWTSLRRTIFRGSAGSRWGKSLRWKLEKGLGPLLEPRIARRNWVLNQSPGDFLNRDPSRVDVLQEYFVPPERFDDFLDEAREILRRGGADLLNVTVRAVRRDDDSRLRYADRDLLALVMLFNQELTPEADAAMAAVTRELIEAALSMGGRYYLPYRPHATREQFRRAYPMAPDVLRLKKKYDPGELFQNAFYRNYLSGGEG